MHPHSGCTPQLAKRLTSPGSAKVLKMSQHRALWESDVKTIVCAFTELALATVRPPGADFVECCPQFVSVSGKSFWSAVLKTQGGSAMIVGNMRYACSGESNSLIGDSPWLVPSARVTIGV